MKKVNIALIGAGNVGKGVVDLIKENGRLISERTGIKMILKTVCDKDKRALKRLAKIKGAKATTDYRDVINDKDIDIVLQLIGGINPAKQIMLAAMAKGKHVVTANKALLSTHWQEISDAAAGNKIFLGYEASVGGAIPIIRSIKQSFVTNKLQLVYGILNGTTNFILTMMAEKSYSFNQALKIAQEKGIAEKDPTLDINGGDSAHKLAIIAMLGFGAKIGISDVYKEGIESITPLDIQYAWNWGYVIKLLAVAKKSGKELELRVHPALLPDEHMLSAVKGEDNAVFVNGDFIGDSLLYGKGAGSRPTASSVVSDAIDIAKVIKLYEGKTVAPCSATCGEKPVKVKSHDKLVLPYYLRFSIIDKPGILARISSVLAKNGISIERVSQEVRKEGKSVPLIILTHNAKEGNMQKAIREIDKLSAVTEKTVMIRIEG